MKKIKTAFFFGSLVFLLAGFFVAKAAQPQLPEKVISNCSISF